MLSIGLNQIFFHEIPLSSHDWGSFENGHISDFTLMRFLCGQIPLRMDLIGWVPNLGSTNLKTWLIEADANIPLGPNPITATFGLVLFWVKCGLIIFFAEMIQISKSLSFYDSLTKFKMYNLNFLENLEAFGRIARGLQSPNQRRNQNWPSISTAGKLLWSADRDFYQPKYV